MQFEAKNEHTLKEEMLMEPGVYDFTVVKAVDKQSKAGNDMIELNLQVFLADGTHRYQNDWLMGHSPQMLYKMNHFCQATGLMEKYNNGTLAAIDCQGVSGRVKIGTKSDEQYGPQNTVKDYIKPEEVAGAPVAMPTAQRPASAPPRSVMHEPKPPQAGASNDDIPFALGDHLP